MLYNKQEKLKNKALFTPNDFLALQNIKLSLPPTVIMMPYSESGYIKEISKKHYKLFADIDIVSDKLAIASNFGIGGPMSVFLAEMLSVCGVKNFILLGIAGGISPTLNIDDTVLCTGALCDDGTSKDYFGGEVAPAAQDICKSLAPLGAKESGITWTTDSIFRETKEEVAHYCLHGIKTVEMEAAPVFAFAYHKQLNAAAVFVISDLLSAQDWKPHKVAQKTNRILTQKLQEIIKLLA